MNPLDQILVDDVSDTDSVVKAIDKKVFNLKDVILIDNLWTISVTPQINHTYLVVKTNNRYLTFRFNGHRSR